MNSSLHAEALLEYETLNGDEITLILKGEKLNRGDDSSDADDEKPAVVSGSVPTAGGDDLG